ncbi:hypothetical protein ACLOJK_006995, partial [Asimina triloba]
TDAIVHHFFQPGAATVRTSSSKPPSSAPTTIQQIGSERPARASPNLHRPAIVDRQAWPPVSSSRGARNPTQIGFSSDPAAPSRQITIQWTTSRPPPLDRPASIGQHQIVADPTHDRPWQPTQIASIDPWLPDLQQRGAVTFKASSSEQNFHCARHHLRVTSKQNATRNPWEAITAVHHSIIQTMLLQPQSPKQS